MPANIAKALARRFRRRPEPGEVAVVLTSDPGIPSQVDPTNTNLRSARGARDRALAKTRGMGSSSMFGRMHDNRDRIDAYRDYRQLDANIPEAGAALDAIATSATGGEPGNEICGFDLNFAPSLPEPEQQFITNLVERLQLRTMMKPLVRESNRMGDVMFHVIVDRQGNILGLKYLEPALLFIVEDEFGRHMGWEYFGYEEGERLLLLWEVIHLRHMPELGSKFGRSIFASGLRPTGFSLQGMRDSTMVQVVKNASGQTALIFGVPSNQDPDDRLIKLEEMYELTSRAPVIVDGKLDRRVIEGMNEQPLVLFYDVFPDGNSPEPKIEQLGATKFEGLVAVLEHWQDLFLVPLKVPKAQIGIERSGEGIGGNRLTVQDVAFGRYLNGEQKDEVWFVHQVVALAYWLRGVVLPADSFEVVMPDLGFLDLKTRYEIRKLAMEASQIAASIGLPTSYIWTELIWDGDVATAQDMADRYGVDLDGNLPGGVDDGEPIDAAAVDEARRRINKTLRDDIDLVRQALTLAKGARGSNG